MRKIIIFLVMVLTISPAFAEEPDYINGFVTGANYGISKDTIFGKYAAVYVTNISINNSLTLENTGRINGTLNLCDGCQLFLENSGFITGKINVGNNASLTQVIKSNSDISQLSTNNYKYSILIQNNDDIKFSEILSVSGNASKITLSDASIILDKSILVLPEIELVGQTKIKIDGKYVSDGSLLLSNVSGTGVVSVDISDLDGLYTASATRQDDSIYLNIERETDYQKVLGASRGSFINNLRISSPRNPTILAMDRESTVSGFYSIIRRSVLFNPINLMNPIKRFNNFELNSAKKSNDSDTNNLDAIYISADGLYMYGVRASLGESIGSHNISISSYVGRFDNDDEINKFAGTFYGGSIRDYVKDGSLWIDAVVGASIASFKTDIILDGDKIVYNPNGISIYSTVDMGLRLDFCDGFYFSPFVGIGGDYEKVLSQTSSKISGRTGGLLGFSEEVDGLKTDYQLFGNIQTNNIQTAGVLIKFWSVADFVGGNINYSISHDEFGFSNKIGAGINIIF